MSFTKNTGSVMPVPCSEWAEKLAATHPDDLSLAERAALNQHIAICAACAAVRDEYRSMDVYILELPAVAPLPTNMMQPGQLEEVSKERNAPFPVAPRTSSTQSGVRLSRVGKMLSTIAAVLVVGVIVGSFVLLFSLNRADDMFSSSPDVSGQQTIYVATDVAKSVAYAINPTNGAIIWKHMLGYKLTGPSIVVHGLVIFASYNGFIYAYHTSNGSFVWKSRVGSGDSAAPSLTPSSSSNDAVYFSTVGGEFGALSTSKGSILWKKHLSTCMQNCDEFGAQVVNGVYYAFANGLFALNANSGDVIWQNLNLKMPASFALVGGNVYVLPAQPGVAPKQNPSQVMEPKQNLWTILILNASNGHQIGTEQGQDVAAGNGVLYIENLDTTWYAMRVSDGKVLWRNKTPGCSGDVFGGSLSGDTIFSVSNISYVSSTSLSGPNITPTTVQSQSGYSEICAMSTGDGSIRWDWKTSTLEMVTTPVELNGVAYYEHNTDLEARRVSDGKVLWRVPFTSSLQGPTIG